MGTAPGGYAMYVDACEATTAHGRIRKLQCSHKSYIVEYNVKTGKWVLTIESTVAGFHGEVIQKIWDELMVSPKVMTKPALAALRSDIENQLLAEAVRPKKRAKTTTRTDVKCDVDDDSSESDEFNDFASSYFLDP